VGVRILVAGRPRPECLTSRPRALLPCSFWDRPYTLDSLAPRSNYRSCHDVAKLYSVRLYQETWLTSATQPRSFAGASLFLRRVMPRGLKGERRLAPHSPLRPPYPRRPSHPSLDLEFFVTMP
jgi:hypothetical protein